MTDQEKKKGLPAALEDLKEAFCDLSSQETQTYVGDLKVVVDSINSTDLKTLLKSGAVKGDLELTAVTRISFDGDGIVLCPKEPLPDHVLDAHQAALEAGRNTREGLIALFSNVIGLGKK